jgi:hypothetical protein
MLEMEPRVLHILYKTLSTIEVHLQFSGFVNTNYRIRWKVLELEIWE